MVKNTDHVWEIKALRYFHRDNNAPVLDYHKQIWAIMHTILGWCGSAITRLVLRNSSMYNDIVKSFIHVVNGQVPVSQPILLPVAPRNFSAPVSMRTSFGNYTNQTGRNQHGLPAVYVPEDLYSRISAKEFKCLVCKMTFTAKCSVKRHILKQHPYGHKTVHLLNPLMNAPNQMSFNPESDFNN